MTAQEGLLNVLNGYLQSAGNQNSVLGQLTKSILYKVLSSYSGVISGDAIDLDSDSPVGKLRVKWTRQIQRDLNKLELSDGEKKIGLAVSLASIYAQVISSKDQNQEQQE